MRLGMSGNLLNTIFVKVDIFLRTAPLRINVDGVESPAIWPETARTPQILAHAGVLWWHCHRGLWHGWGAAASVLDPTPAEALGRALSFELQPSGTVASRSWGSVLDMRDNELSPPSFGEGVVPLDVKG